MRRRLHDVDDTRRGPVAKEVDVALGQDPVAREALQRGIVNLRALSRWLIRTRGWNASEEAVLSALRRRKPQNGLPTLRQP